MKIYILLMSLSMGLAEKAIKAPYLPSGWRPKGPAFELPTEIKKPIIPTESIADFEPEESSFLREYGPPNVIVDKVNLIQDSVRSVQNSIGFIHDSGSLVHDSGSLVQDSDSLVQDSGSFVQDSGSFVQDSVRSVQNSIGFIHDSGSLVHDSGILVQDSDSLVQDSGSFVQDSGGLVQDSLSSVQESVNPIKDSIETVKESISSVQDSEDQNRQVKNAVNLIQDSISSVQDTIDLVEPVNPVQDSISLVEDSVNVENYSLQDKSQIVSEDILQDLTVQALPDEDINLNFRKYTPEKIENYVLSDSLTENYRNQVVNVQSQVESNSEQSKENEDGKNSFDVVLVNEKTRNTELEKGIEKTDIAANKNDTEEKSSEINIPVGFREYGPPDVSSQQSKIHEKIYRAPEYLPPQGFKRNVRKIRLVSAGAKLRNHH